MIIMFALVLYIGTIFMRDNPKTTTNDVFTAIYAITLSVGTVYNNTQLFDGFSEIKKAATLF